MIKRQSTDWDEFLRVSLERLLSQAPLRFSQMTPSILPETAGIYLITKVENNVEIPYYIGRTRNMQKRLYSDHLMGGLSSAPLKKYLIDNHVCSTIEEAKEFIQKHCMARWIEEPNYRRRGAIEGFCTASLFPVYGIDKEH